MMVDDVGYGYDEYLYKFYINFTIYWIGLQRERRRRRRRGTISEDRKIGWSEGRKVRNERKLGGGGVGGGGGYGDAKGCQRVRVSGYGTGT